MPSTGFWSRWEGREGIGQCQGSLMHIIGGEFRMLWEHRGGAPQLLEVWGGVRKVSLEEFPCGTWETSRNYWGEGVKARGKKRNADKWCEACVRQEGREIQKTGAHSLCWAGWRLRKMPGVGCHFLLQQDTVQSLPDLRELYIQLTLEQHGGGKVRGTNSLHI